MKRYLENQVKIDLSKKMVFISGPRQVGKTTLAQSLDSGAAYLNWDITKHRQLILDGKLPENKFYIFDEIHKWPRWRNYIKGIFDEFKNKKKILVTGSARLDLFRFSGDSLQGRYFHLKLHPLSVAELKIANQNDFETLLALGGFPEPFFSGSEKEAKRWSRDYRSLLIKEDISDMESIKDLGSLELLLGRLPALVGSPLSINSLREDIQTAHSTMSNWVSALERLYAIFRISPFGSPKIKAVKKEQKHYHFDWTVVPSKGAKFENLVACHLLKWIDYKNDTEGEDYELRYFRDIESREVDFVITRNNKIEVAIECKYDSTKISSHLKYLKSKFPNILAIQLSQEDDINYVSKDGIKIISAYKYLSELI